MADHASLPTETTDLVAEILRKTVGAGTEIESYNVLNQHRDYYALLVTLRDPAIDVVVKLAGREAPYPYPFERTALLHRLVKEHTSIPMAEVLAVDVSYQTYPWRYLITTHIPGEEWAAVKPRLTPFEQQDAYQQIGTAVAELHRIPFDSFGEIDESEQKSGMYFLHLGTRVKTQIKNKRHRDHFLQLLGDKRHLFITVTEPYLCHEDLHHHNILFQQKEGRWRLATVLDFDKAWAGHPEIDLARMELWDDMTGPGFWDSYTDFIQIDSDYAERRPIYQLLWCLEYAANTPRHLADTQRLCQELGFPMIEQFE